MSKKETNSEKKSVQKHTGPVPWITAAVVVLILAVLGGLYWKRTSKVKDIQYRGFTYTTEKQLRQQVKIPTGVHPDSLNMVGIMKQIEKLPYVKLARLNVDPGGTMDINITERQPIAMLVSGSRRAYVDADGIRLPRVLGKTPDVPLLYGFATAPVGDTLKSAGFKEVSAFLQELHQRKTSDATISEIAWNSDEGVIALTNDNGVKVIFGKGEFDKRLRNWEAFCREVVRQKGMDKMRSVDLRFEGQIVTREK